MGGFILRALVVQMLGLTPRGVEQGGFNFRGKGSIHTRVEGQVCWDLKSVDPSYLDDNGHLCPSGTWLQLEPR